MKRTPLLLGVSLLMMPAMADEAPAPSLDLLLYLAEWTPDRNGRLTDPLEVPDGAGPPAGLPSAAADIRPRPATEYAR